MLEKEERLKINILNFHLMRLKKNIKSNPKDMKGKKE